MRIFSHIPATLFAFVGTVDQSSRTSVKLDATRSEVLERWRSMRIFREKDGLRDAPTVDDFSYTEALMSAANDPAVKEAFKKARSAMTDFVSDVNAIYLAAKTPYLQDGNVTMPYTNRVVYRDSESNVNQISNSGIVRLVQAATDSQMLEVKSFGTPGITAYSTKQTTTAKSFNIDMITQTMNTLFSSWQEGTTQGVEASVAAVGSLLNSSFTENKQESTSITISPLCAFDYDSFWDEVTASYQTSIFNISLSTWKTVEKKKGTTSETDQVESAYAVEAYRNGINLPRLVAYYGYGNDTQLGGNVAEIGALNSTLLPLPKPNVTEGLFLTRDIQAGSVDACGLPVFRG